MPWTKARLDDRSLAGCWSSGAEELATRFVAFAFGRFYRRLFKANFIEAATRGDILFLVACINLLTY